MTTEFLNLKIVVLLAVGLSLAALLGYFSYRIKMSPILGYLLAGYLIGPYSPGFVGDRVVAEQLAEIGVILMMFGVGMHLKREELLNVKNIAIPGAIGQTFFAATAGTALVYMVGWPLESGVILGLAIGVASTVVLVRVLTDNQLLHTPEGHIAVGWLIVEDLITVVVLVLVPTLDYIFKGGGIDFASIGLSLLVVLSKFILLTILMFTFVRKIVVYILSKVDNINSHELFTLTILALTLLLAAGSSLIFGTSIALGAFLAGMVIGQTTLRRQIATNTMPLKDTFVVIFFLSIGMLFNPSVIVERFPLFLGILAIILILKPFVAFLITVLLKYPFKTAITVALALAQIGEFSFILSEEANKYDLLPDDGYDLIVACALVSIPLNPLLFKWKDLIKDH